MIPLLSGASDENNMTGKTREKWERNMHGTLHNCEKSESPRGYRTRHPGYDVWKFQELLYEAS